MCFFSDDCNSFKSAMVRATFEEFVVLFHMFISRIRSFTSFMADGRAEDEIFENLFHPFHPECER